MFILGAGASWHYGYPTGEDLVDYVGAMALKFEAYCRNRLNSHQFSHQIPKYVGSKLDRSKGSSGAAEAWQATADECRALIERIKSVRPLVIDYFLAWNEDLKDIGNLMIAAVILECEGFWNTFRRNRNDPKAPVRSHDWYRFIIHNIVYRCGTSKDLFENQVHFVTFNYDTSLETRLFSALSAIKMFSPNDIEQFLYDQRVVHVYGSVNTGGVRVHTSQTMNWRWL